MPPGANRVKVDACTNACGVFPSGWTQGTATASATPGIPAGVDPAQVQGIRVTFSNSSNGFTLTPGQYLPNAGACKLASVCFNVTAREFKRSNSAERIPLGVIDDHSDGDVVTNLPTPATIHLSTVTAPLEFIDGSPRIKFTKGPNSKLGPNDTAPFDLTIENTGTTAVATPSIVDKLPDNLALDENPPGGTVGKPWIVSYPALPAGITGPPKDDITYDFTPGSNLADPFQGATVRWTFGTFNLPPGGKINIRIYVKLAGSYTVGTPITNTAGASGTNPSSSVRPETLDLRSQTPRPMIRASTACRRRTSRPWQVTRLMLASGRRAIRSSASTTLIPVRSSELMTRHVRSSLT